MSRTETCLDCQVLPPFSVVLCPLHAAAPALVALLADVERYCPVPVQDRIRAALGQARGEPAR